MNVRSSKQRCKRWFLEECRGHSGRRFEPIVIDAAERAISVASEISGNLLLLAFESSGPAVSLGRFAFLSAACADISSFA